MKICVLVFLAIFSLTIRGERTPSPTNVVANTIAETDLLWFFDSVFSTGTNFTFVLKSGGTGFLYAIDDREPKVGDYGETIVLPFGSTLKMVDRHHSMSFTALPDGVAGDGFKVTLREDFRSMRGELVQKDACLVAERRRVDDATDSVKLQKTGIWGIEIHQLRKP